MNEVMSPVEKSISLNNVKLIGSASSRIFVMLTSGTGKFENDTLFGMETDFAAVKLLKRSLVLLIKMFKLLAKFTPDSVSATPVPYHSKTF